MDYIYVEKREEKIKEIRKIYKKPDGGSTMKKTKPRRDQKYQSKGDCRFNWVGQKNHTDNVHLNKDLKAMRDSYADICGGTFWGGKQVQKTQCERVSSMFEEKQEGWCGWSRADNAGGTGDDAKLCQACLVFTLCEVGSHWSVLR